MSANFGSAGGITMGQLTSGGLVELKLGTFSWMALFSLCAVYLLLTVWTLPGEVPVRFGMDGESISGFTRRVFIYWMIGFLLGLNGLFFVIKTQLRNGRWDTRVRVPWRNYWHSCARRRTEAVQRLQDVMVMAGLMVNVSWLISYHLIMQEVGQALVLSISTSFGVYLILVSAVVLVYGAITYFRPP